MEAKFIQVARSNEHANDSLGIAFLQQKTVGTMAKHLNSKQRLWKDNSLHMNLTVRICQRLCKSSKKLRSQMSHPSGNETVKGPKDHLL